MSHYERIKLEFMENEISYIDAIEELQKYLEIDSFKAEEIVSRWANNKVDEGDNEMGLTYPYLSDYDF